MRIVLCTAIVFVALLAMHSALLADMIAAPYAYITVSESRRCYFKMVPEHWSVDHGKRKRIDAAGTCYQLEEDGTEKIIWTTKGWYAYQVYLPRDSEYLVRLGNWPSGQKPAAKDLAVAFYKNGKQLKSYSTKELIKDVRAIHPSVSHYDFMYGPAELHSSGNSEEFELTTIDRIRYTFDITTGGIKSQVKLKGR